MKKQTAEELAEKYSIAPLSQQDKDSVIRFKGDNLKITQEIQRLAFLAGFQARDEQAKDLLDDVVYVLSLAEMDNFSHRELAFEAKILLQKIKGPE